MVVIQQKFEPERKKCFFQNRHSKLSSLHCCLSCLSLGVCVCVCFSLSLCKAATSWSINIDPHTCSELSLLMAQVCVTEHRGNTPARFSAARTKQWIGSLPSSPVLAWKYHVAASFTDATGLSWAPNQAQRGNYEACLKKYSFPKAGGEKRSRRRGGQERKYCLCSVQTTPSQTFIKFLPKCHSIKLCKTWLYILWMT